MKCGRRIVGQFTGTPDEIECFEDRRLLLYRKEEAAGSSFPCRIECTSGLASGFHLAAQTQVQVANDNPVSTFTANVAGTWSGFG